MTEEKPRILVVDDTPENIDMLSSVLASEYKVMVATNGMQALKIAQCPRPPELILLDVLMPEMDGYEVCSTLKQNPATASIPVIFVTAMGEVKDEIKCLSVGGEDYITKPFSAAVVSARVGTHLNLKRKSDLLESMTCVDGLVNVNNRLRFDAMLKYEWNRCRREESELSLLLLDVNRLAEFNELYGYVAGDNCLVKVSKTIKATLGRATDFIARYSGGCFAVILPGTGQTSSQILAERVQRNIEILAVPHAGSLKRQITLSAGIASMLPVSGCSVDTLVEAAEIALETSKGCQLGNKC